MMVETILPLQLCGSRDFEFEGFPILEDKQTN